MKDLATTKKITMATVKSFVKANAKTLLIKVESRFSGMSDMVENDLNAMFNKVTTTDSNVKNNLGINGAWFVGSSRDYFNYFKSGELEGIEVFNACGSFILAIKK